MTTRSMLNFGLRSALNAATSSSLTSGLRGAGVAPNLRIAKNATTNSTPLGNSIATRSPATTPWVERSRANPDGKSVELRPGRACRSPQSSAVFAPKRRALDSTAQTKFGCSAMGEIVSLNLAKRSSFRYFVAGDPLWSPEPGQAQGLAPTCRSNL